MIQFTATPSLVNPVMLCAFQGWNDAAGAASETVAHLIEAWDATQIAAFDPEDYYDFQVNRPIISLDDEGMRQISWPTTRIYQGRPPGSLQDVILVAGIEPNLRWRDFTSELLDFGAAHEMSLLVTIGALLAEVPHTRPVRVTGMASEVDLEDRLGLTPATYEGPTGIVGVIQDACTRLDLPAVSYWAAIPHYLPQSPNPKATVALISHLEELLDLSIDLGELPEDIQAWERGVAELAAEDEEIMNYVRSLEESHDADNLPEASGEEIAKEFERYLKRRDRPQQP